jgi:hypothetical protein
VLGSFKNPFYLRSAFGLQPNTNYKLFINLLIFIIMGTFNKGILGGFSGKVGTVVGFNWRGLDVMRSLPKK